MATLLKKDKNKEDAAYIIEVTQGLFNRIAEGTYSDIPRGQSSMSETYWDATHSAKLESRVELVAGDEIKGGALDQARKLAALAVETNNDALSTDGITYLKMAYNALGATHDSAYILAQQDIEAFKEIKASKDMIEKMSASGKGWQDKMATKNSNKPFQKY